MDPQISEKRIEKIYLNIRILKNKKDIIIRITMPAIMPVKVSHDHFLIIQIGRSILKSIISPPTSVHLFLALISALAMVWIFILKTRLYKISALNSNPEYVRSIFSWCKRYEKKKKFSLFTISKVMNGTSGQFYSFFANIDFAFSWGTGFWISYERYYNQFFQ